MTDKKKILNKEQLAAIKHGKGPLLIIAGAGTGKTTVVTERIKYLISKKLAKPSEILALTFTEKAAAEMEERVDVIMPYGYTQMWISTFHSFCDRILRDEAIHIGLDPRFRLMTEAETTQFLRKNLFQFDLDYFRPLGNPTKFLSGMRQHFSRLQDEDVSPNVYLRWAQAQSSSSKPKIDNNEIKKYLELARTYQTYSQLKVKQSLMDFSDLISNTLLLFRKRPSILKQYQKQFKFILVDEFQDTNIAQNELAMLLTGPPVGEAGKKQNLTVCLDDDQAIYRWRGAAVSNAIQFRKKFPRAKIVVLIKNYRSTQEILDRSYQLIQNNNPDRLEVKEKINKKLVSVRKIAGQEIKLMVANREEDETELVAKEIHRLTNELPATRHPELGSGSTQSTIPKRVRNDTNVKYDYKDIAILVRANNHAEAFGRALDRANIPYQFLGPGKLFRQGEIKDLIAYLKLLYNFEDSVAMYRILTMEIFAINARDLATIGNLARKLNLSLFEACEKITKAKDTKYQIPNTTYQINISQKSRNALKNIIAMIHRHFELIPRESAGQIIYYFLQDSGLLQTLTEAQTLKEEQQTQNISKFFDRLKTYEINHEDASVSAVCDWIELAMELGESPSTANNDWTKNDAVNILTIHSAKGLEFPIVFLVNLVTNRFPTTNRREQIPIPESLVKEVLPEGDYHLQEERRLFYVGLTRAQNQVYLTAANYYGSAKRQKKLSPFISETLGEKAIKDQSREAGSRSAGQSEIKNQLSIFNWQKSKADKLPSRPADKSPITYLSYSQISAFDHCPLQYRYRYLQKIPSPTSSALSFGQTIHTTLFEFYHQLKKGKKPTQKNLLTLLKGNWLPFGYTSKSHETKMKKEGQKILIDFYKKEHDPKTVIKDLEQSFAIRISPTLKIGGRIDRVDQLANGKIKIIDYKTGKTMTEKDVEKSLQMTIYALAASQEGAYNQPPKNIILSFYFLSSGEKISTQRTNQQLQKAKEKLLEKKEEIENNQFTPKPTPLCKFCEYKMICEAWQ